MSPVDGARHIWRRPRVIVAIGAVAVLVALVAARGRLSRFLPAFAGGSRAGVVERVVPEGTRVKVEVLNATDTRGLARTAAAVLRDAGFDVVFFGNTAERRDSTLVRDRSNHPEWATLAARTMAPSGTEVRPDSGRLVDLTILVGRAWRPPTDPFRP